ncbi:MAG: peptidylprolyl isomerase [Acidobacteriota bacterium]
MKRQWNSPRFMLPMVLGGTLLMASVWAQEAKPEKPPSDDGDAIVLDEIVARVNSDIITLTDLQRTLKQLHQQVEETAQDPSQVEEEYAKRKRLVLKTIIENKVMVQKAEDAGLAANADADVAAYLERVRKENGIPSLDVLDQYLRQHGSSLPEYKNRVKEQMITQSLLQNFVYSKITLLTPEVEAYYKEHAADFTVPGKVHLAEILLLKEGKSRDQVHQKAEAALDRLNKGEAFEDVAKDVSEGPTASRGGDIGDFNKGSMNEELEAVAFKLPVGEHSGILETDYGFQIIKILGRTPASLKPLEEVRPQIVEQLYQTKAEPEVKEYLKKLFEESYIYVSPRYVDQYDLDGLGI